MKKTVNIILAIVLVAILYVLCFAPFGEGTSAQITANYVALFGVLVWSNFFVMNNPELSDWLRM